MVNFKLLENSLSNLFLIDCEKTDRKLKWLFMLSVHMLEIIKNLC